MGIQSVYTECKEVRLSLLYETKYRALKTATQSLNTELFAGIDPPGLVLLNT